MPSPLIEAGRRCLGMAQLTWICLRWFDGDLPWYNPKKITLSKQIQVMHGCSTHNPPILWHTDPPPIGVASCQQGKIPFSTAAAPPSHPSSSPPGQLKVYWPSGKTNITGWNITIFNKKSGSMGPFSSQPVRFPECVGCFLVGLGCV